MIERGIEGGVYLDAGIVIITFLCRGNYEKVNYC